MKKTSKISTVFLIEKDGKYLFQKRRKANIYGDFYVLPAGHVEVGEKALDAVKRELYEELGIQVAEDDILFKMVEHGEEITVFFFEIKKYLGDIQNKEPDKHIDVCFLSPTDSRVHPMVQKEIECVKNGIAFMDVSAAEIKASVKRRSARAILISKDKKLVLLKRIKNGQTYYVTPGGGIEDNETSLQALIRELKEETGSDILSSRFLFHFEDEEKPNSVDFYLCYEALRDIPTGLEWIKMNAPDNQYEIIEVSPDEVDALDIKPTVLKEKLISLFKENL